MSDLNWRDLLAKHWGKLAGALGGLFFALLIVKYGFWKGSFIVICIAIGLFLGWRVDESNGLRNLLERLFPPREKF